MSESTLKKWEVSYQTDGLSGYCPAGGAGSQLLGSRTLTLQKQQNKA